MTPSIAFPLVSSKSGLIVRLWEDLYREHSTAHFNDRYTTFADLLGNQYDWVDMQLAGQQRTLKIELGYEMSEDASAPLLSTAFGTADGLVNGNSASLALYFATLFKLPVVTNHFTSAWVMTGSLVQWMNDHDGPLTITPMPIEETLLRIKKKLVDADQDIPNQALVCLGDYRHADKPSGMW